MGLITRINFPPKISSQDQIYLEKIETQFLIVHNKLKKSFGVEYHLILVGSKSQSNNIIINIDFPVNASKITKRIVLSEGLKINQAIEKINFDGLYFSEIRFAHKIRFSTEKVSNISDENNEQKIATDSKPSWLFSQIIINDQISRDLERAIALYEKNVLIFETWGLKSIKPRASVLINLSGPPGTGKTMIAHAIADRLNKRIIELSYALIESKYVGEGPKNIRRVFNLAQDTDALIFFDEADSLLGKRIKNVSDGADQAINSMRSQMIIEMDRFQGVAVFATNLLENYDHSFQKRLITISIPVPDELTRIRMFRSFLPLQLPGIDQISDVNIIEYSKLAEGLSGRDIRDAIVLAATDMAINNNCIKDNLYQSIKFISDKQKGE